MSFDLLTFAGAVAGGAAFGAVYFRVLRVAVERLRGADRPQRHVLTGAALRLSAALLVIILAAQLGPEALVGGLLGFVLARSLVLRRARRAISAH